jgi:hypothetical protein
MATSIPVKRLKDETRGDAVGNAGLDDILGLEMAGQTPNRSYQRSITIIPVLEAFGTSPYSL